LIEVAYVDGDGTVNASSYFEYDEEGRVRKKGERNNFSERYWLYEYD
jgi:hypothetical protein